MQKAAVAALTGPQDGVKKAVCGFYEERRDALCGGLNGIGWQVPVFRRYDVCMGAASKGIYLIRKVLHGFIWKIQGCFARRAVHLEARAKVMCVLRWYFRRKKLKRL